MFRTPGAWITTNTGPHWISSRKRKSWIVGQTAYIPNSNSKTSKYPLNKAARNKKKKPKPNQQTEPPTTIYLEMEKAICTANMYYIKEADNSATQSEKPSFYHMMQILKNDSASKCSVRTLGSKWLSKIFIKQAITAFQIRDCNHSTKHWSLSTNILQEAISNNDTQLPPCLVRC